MSAPFSRSMRALEIDSFRPSLLGLLCATLLFVAWLVWFFWAPLGLYQVSETARVVSETQASATFSPNALGRIQPGQGAQLRLTAFPAVQYGTVPARVARIAQGLPGDPLQVEFTLMPAASSIPLQPGLLGTMEVEVERISPAILLLRVSGQVLGPSSSSSATNSAGAKP